ncbi:hypothetical protein SO802_026488 [Lithocarpus litseifolius]|uniref:Uncharacterized protein n=1 Tax=Lithocarpus litseifolius TaxID=425828 RepID=A0AAW2C1Y7_9ROSI
MALKAKSSDTDESSDNEDSKMKSDITRQFKKFMKNTNGKGFDKDRRNKALAATLSDTEPEDDSDNEDDGILNAFTATVNPTKRIVKNVDEEKDLMESKFGKVDEQDDIHIAMQSYTRDLLKALMFLLNLNSFNSPPSPLDQGFAKWKGSSKVWKEKGSK